MTVANNIYVDEDGYFCSEDTLTYLDEVVKIHRKFNRGLRQRLRFNENVVRINHTEYIDYEVGVKVLINVSKSYCNLTTDARNTVNKVKRLNENNEHLSVYTRPVIPSIVRPSIRI